MPRRGRCDGLPGFPLALERKGLQRRFLAKRIGLEYRDLWRMVSGAVKRVDISVLKQMSVELDCSVDDLLTAPTEETELSVGGCQ